ncbi:MAG: hypothetical protein ABIK62_05675, partial [candidate division WOR-3 bacterium]
GDNPEITVIDGSSDAVLARLTTMGQLRAVVFNPNNRRAYALTASAWLYTVDGASNRLVDSLRIDFSATAYSTGLGLSSTANRILCADSVSHYLTVYDCATNQVTGKIVLGSQPIALDYNPLRNRVYAANALTNDVTVIEGYSHATPARIPVGQMPAALCHDSVRIYCANRLSSDVSIIDGAGDSVVATIPVGYSPQDIFYCPSNGLVYVSSEDRIISVIDGNRNSVVDTIRVFNSGRFCYNPTSNRLYCQSMFGVMVINPSTNKVVDTVRARWPIRAMCYNPVDGRLYVAASNQDSIGIVDCTTNRMLLALGVPGEPYALCTDTVNNRVYCVNRRAGRLSVIDCPTASILTNVDVGAGPLAVTYNPINNKVYVARDVAGWNPDSVIVISATSNNVIMRLGIGFGPCALAWNPFENRTYFACSENSCICCVRDIGGAVSEEAAKPQNRPAHTMVANRVLQVPSSTGLAACLMDRTGRTVTRLQAGRNDLTHLAPGVYFLTAKNSSSQSKVILTP